MSVSVGNALPPVGAPSMLCWAHQSHSDIVLPENAQNTAKSGLLKKFKVSNTRAFSLLPGSAPAPQIKKNIFRLNQFIHRLKLKKVGGFV